MVTGVVTVHVAVYRRRSKRATKSPVIAFSPLTFTFALDRLIRVLGQWCAHPASGETFDDAKAIKARDARRAAQLPEMGKLGLRHRVSLLYRQ